MEFACPCRLLPWFLVLRGSRRVAQAHAEGLARVRGEQFPNAHQGIDTPFRARATNPRNTSGPIVGKNQENSLCIARMKSGSFKSKFICSTRTATLQDPVLTQSLAEQCRVLERQWRWASNCVAGKRVPGIKRQARRSQSAQAKSRSVCPIQFRQGAHRTRAGDCRLQATGECAPLAMTAGLS